MSKDGLNQFGIKLAYRKKQRLRYGSAPSVELSCHWQIILRCVAATAREVVAVSFTTSPNRQRLNHDAPDSERSGKTVAVVHLDAARLAQEGTRPRRGQTRSRYLLLQRGRYITDKTRIGKES